MSLSLFAKEKWRIYVKLFECLASINIYDIPTLSISKLEDFLKKILLEDTFWIEYLVKTEIVQIIVNQIVIVNQQ